MKIGEAYFEVRADTDKFEKDVDKGTKSAMSKVAKTAGGILAAKELVDFGAATIGAASDLAESTSKVQAVFGPLQGEIEAWASTGAKAFGQSKTQALEAAGSYGNLFQAFGLGQEPAAEMSTSLTELAADLASFNNTSIDEALLALRSGLSGETEPLKRYGVAISDVRLKEQALSMGLIKSTKEALTPAAKAQASYALIMKDTALAQGDFARTSDGLANKQRIASAEFANLQATLGAVLLPIMLAVVSFITDTFIPAIAALGRFISENREYFIAIAGVIAAFLIPAFVAWAISAGTAAAAQIALYAPIVLIIAAVAALVAGVVWAYQNWDWFRAAVDKVVSVLKGTLIPVFQAVWSFITTKIIPILGEVIGWFASLAVKVGEIAVTIAQWVINRINDFITFRDKVLEIGGKVVEWFGSLGSKIGEALSGVADKITTPFKSAFNAIARLWNRTVGSISFTTPDWVPGIGGKGFSVPDIPEFHSGGVVGGPAGSEQLIMAKAGELVLTAEQANALSAALRSSRATGGNGEAFRGTSAAGGISIQNLVINASSTKQGTEVLDEALWRAQTAGV